MPEPDKNAMAGDFRFPDLSDLSASILASGCREVDMLMASKTLVGGGETVLVRGDVAEGGGVSDSRAVVVDGGILGSANEPCRIVSTGPVVVMGSARFAHIRGQSIYLEKGARECQLSAEADIFVLGDLVDSEVQLGVGADLAQEIETHQIATRTNRETREQLLRQVRYEKNRLNVLLQATGIVFNLNIGQIVRQSDEGLTLNLAPFYNALEGRSETAIDQALKEFFAKAVLGLLTRLNQRYISEGPGHRQRFAAVVRKLRDLVFVTRSYDKAVVFAQTRETVLWERLIAAKVLRNTLYVAGGILPTFRARFFQVLFDKEQVAVAAFRVRTLALSLRTGNLRGRDEIVLWRDGETVDLVVVPAGTLSQVALSPREDRVTWTSLASE